MPTLTLPRTLGSRVGAAAAVAALTLAGAPWLAAPSAVAQTNGDIRIHRLGVPFGVAKDDPVVCRFYLDATNFGIDTSIAYRIEPQPPLPTGDGYNGSITLAGGVGQTEPLGLANGQYRLTFPASPTATVPAPREKIFRVNCHEDNRHEGGQGPNQIDDGGRDDQRGEHGGGGADRDDPPRPKGGVHAGGGGLVDTAQAFSPVAGAAAVGLVVVSGVAYVRLVRRRPHGAA
ncbi:hypothetical protein ABZ484_20075 [Streptomyces sp. NPDC006393]|uniref:hypothetical protein n=1 Tax=Streptomyces sp. NPDC006393 TaxID=3156763 RepID=UPI0033D5D2BE